jgi:hypothetical protein
MTSSFQLWLTMVLAARLPFRRVIGVEIDSELVATAHWNFQQSARHRRCSNLEIVAGDAAKYDCPDDATVLHFFDPFAGVALEQVIENIRISHCRVPRRLTVLFADPNHFDPLVEKADWLVKKYEVPYPFRQGTELIRESYYIYQTRL